LIVDLESELIGDQLNFDVCIVGAGPAGISIAMELLGRGIRVCLLESGGRKSSDKVQALYNGENLGHPMDLSNGRYRIFGGSATQWGGRSAKLDPIDFERRDWVKESGWPISLEALKPYYARAKVASNFKQPWLDDEEVILKISSELPKFKSENIQPFVWRIASPDISNSILNKIVPRNSKGYDWAAANDQRLKSASDVLVILNATMTSVATEEDGSALSTITIKALNGASTKIGSKLFVYACGGIENARNLLISPPAMLKRLNAFDNVGRYFAQHPRGVIGTMHAGPASVRKIQSMFNYFIRPPRYPIRYEVGMALSEDAQQRHGLLNASVAFAYNIKAAEAWGAAQRIRVAIKNHKRYDGLADDLLRLTREGASLAPFAFGRYIIGKEVVQRAPVIQVVMDVEQEPNRESRISLSSRRDAFGVPVTEADWKITEAERRTAFHFGQFIAQDFHRAGMGHIEHAAWTLSREPITGKDLAGNFHHIGATRMSVDPKKGVVDQNCRAHGVRNLYLAGASVFPTGGHANPTLTIVALSIRLADHLREALSEMSLE
jgi:choline dehydrogenase-like flavoprotein